MDGGWRTKEDGGWMGNPLVSFSWVVLAGVAQLGSLDRRGFAGRSE
jgi:hypothetical protein